MNATDPIVTYMLHDPIGNTEGEIAEYDKAKLLAAAEQGAVFVAVHASGAREVADPHAIERPRPMACGQRLATSDDLAALASAVAAALAGDASRLDSMAAGEVS